MHHKLRYTIYFIIIIILAGGLYFVFANKTVAPVGDNGVATTTENNSSIVQYKNTQYGFSMTLPDSWKDFTVIEDEWEGYKPDAKVGQIITETGPLVSLRHPDWEYKAPRQDIPIMVFTIVQWNDMQADKFHIGAAPINPSEIGRNSKYVFAIPARYNFAYLIGYEEVDQIIRGDNFQSF